mmetsp:Transcript_17629/g.45128  ORF Transcript_17629/g.45128 Transcript_17629/m.45128 type:complete len:374 (+) Transcript_17629:2130-3251(+)
MAPQPAHVCGTLRLGLPAPFSARSWWCSRGLGSRHSFLSSCSYSSASLELMSSAPGMLRASPVATSAALNIGGPLSRLRMMTPAMSVTKVSPQPGKRTAQVLASPMATPACVTMLFQNCLRCSAGQPAIQAPHAQPAQMAPSRTPYTRPPSHRVPASALSRRLAPASMKKGTLVTGITAPSRRCSSSFSASALPWRRLVAMRPTTTHASSGSHCSRSAVPNMRTTRPRMTPACSLRARPGRRYAGSRPCLGRSSSPTTAAPAVPIARLASRLSTGSSSPASVSAASGSLLNTARATSMLSANAAMTTTSLTTTTAMTRLVKGPRASVSLSTAMADAGLRAIMRQPAREQKACSCSELKSAIPLRSGAAASSVR